MNRVLMSNAEFGFAVRPTHVSGLRRCAATIQMATTAGNIAKAAHWNTNAILSPGVFHSAGNQCHANLNARKKCQCEDPIPDQHVKEGPLA
jgi:hypothetical protein